jgi:serine-type D-Ala-D-Ala carboxypeptidase
MKIKLVFGLISILFFSQISTGVCQQHETNLQFIKDLHRTEQQFVVINNPQKKLPVSGLGSYNIASVCFGIRWRKTFDSLMNKYEKVNSFVGYDQNSEDSLNDLNDRLKFQQVLVLAFSENTDFNPALLGFISEMEKNKQVIVVFFGNPKKLALLNLRAVPCSPGNFWWNKPAYKTFG